MSDEKTKRAMMAADICERAALAFRGDRVPRWNIELAIKAAANLRVDDDAATQYRVGITWLGLTPEQIDAAVSAIERGEHPADSLPGKIEEAQRKARHALTLAPALREPTRAAKVSGEIVGMNRVLDLLGVKP